MRRLMVLGVAVLAGCAARVSYLPNADGGYTLVAQAKSMDAAADGFRAKAEQLCGGTRYAMTEPKVTGSSWRFNAYGGGSSLSVQTTLTCR